MTVADFVGGEPLWLDVGLHCRGRGAPPGKRRVKQDTCLAFFSKKNGGCQ